ncbi:MAG: efflux transporter outer membrane subunit [Magnetococcales bacterium]|nr:efflux transporter outer membrane subunit [Magnetococcales bacterium]
MRKHHLFPTALLLLSGCSFLPAYERPVAPIATEWPAQAAGQRSVAGLSWQQMLPDPHLHALIETALVHNRDLHIAVANVEQARALYGIAHADQLPTLGLNGSDAVAHTPADLSLTGKQMTGRRYDVALGATAFELDFWGRVSSLNEAARARFLATEQAQEAFRLSLIADVASAYFAWQALDEQLHLARATVDNREKFLYLARKRRDVGLAGDLDVRVAEGAYETVRAQIAELERTRSQAENALVLLVGTPATDLPAGQRLTEQHLPLDLAAAVPSEVLTNRPDVRAAEANLIAANANIGAARADFLPRVNLNLAFGTATSAFSGLFAAGSGAWSFTPTLVQPLFDSGRTQAAVDLAEARKVAAVAEYEKSIQQAFREVADLLVARDRLAEQLRAQEATDQAQSSRLHLVEARYEGGASNYLEVLDAQRDSFAAAQATVQVRRALLTSAAQLYKALGGGGVAGGR